MQRDQVQPDLSYPASAETMERVNRSQHRLADMINANPEEVIVSHSTPMNLFVLAYAPIPSLDTGDNFFVVNLDHEANNRAWRRLQKSGILIRERHTDQDSTDFGGPQKLEKLLKDRTQPVCRA